MSSGLGTNFHANRSVWYELMNRIGTTTLPNIASDDLLVTELAFRSMSRIVIHPTPSIPLSTPGSSIVQVVSAATWRHTLSGNADVPIFTNLYLEYYIFETLTSKRPRNSIP